MNKLREAVQRSEYALGLTLFRDLHSPTPLEQRYAGICLMHIGQYPESGLRLRQAIAGGDQGAGIYLAALYMLQAQSPKALDMLEQIDPETLSADDAALWYRERARIGWFLVEEKSTLLSLAEQAWLKATVASVPTQVSVATLVGSLLSHFGEHERGLAYLDFAAENGQARRQEHVALCRAVSLTALSRFDEAERQLAAAVSPNILVLKELERVALLDARQDWKAARSALNELLPRTVRHPSHELRTRTALLKLAILDGDAAQAQIQLARGDQLVQAPFNHFLFQHRAGQWLSRQGDERGLERLRSAAQGLTQAGHSAIGVVVLLSLAEAEPDQRQKHLQEAARLVAQLGTPPNLAAEWPLLPGVREALLRLPSQNFERLMLLGEAPEPLVELRTLGHGDLLLAGQRVGFRLARTVEILAYLRRKRIVTMRDVQRELFPDVPEQRARNYFHQVRVELTTRVPGLDIQFDSKQRTYQLRGRVKLVWDVETLEEALKQGQWPPFDLGTKSLDFLPTVEGEWVQEERERLKRWVTQVGLDTMEQWYQEGQYDKCISLAERLLRLDPFDESLHVFLLNATFRVRGRLIAVRLYRESASMFVREVGEIPVSLQTLADQWQTLN